MIPAHWPHGDVEGETGALEFRILCLCAIVEFCLLCCWVFGRLACAIVMWRNKRGRAEEAVGHFYIVLVHAKLRRTKP